ncbi:MAG: hypothetical protein HRU20_05485 [Pseudomonadales bacterium]|nr:hypothetical protein [Pseudomonadales bacterium]
MFMRKVKQLFLALTVLPLSVGAVETHLSGFGSIIGTSILDGEGYWVEHPSGAGYYVEDDNVGLEIEEESLVGLQGRLQFTPEVSITGQVIMRGQSDWQPTMDQLYISYDVTNAWNTKFGKMRNPVYLYSDAMDIHYAFGWMRTPGVSYNLSAIDFDGLSAMYTGAWGEVSNRTIFYYGKVDKDPDPFLTELFINGEFSTQFTTGGVDENGNFFLQVEQRNTIENLWGISTEFYLDSWTLHLAFMEDSGDVGIATYSDGSTFEEEFPWRDFYDVAISYDDGNWIAITEWNQFKGVYTSYYVTFGKYISDWQVLLTYGNFQGEVKLGNGFVLPDESQVALDTFTISGRYDFAAGIAFKTELLFFKNENSLIVFDTDGDGEIESILLSIGFDFVF